MTKPPIFIVGCPRSGTTLLTQMLDRHPSLAVCKETHFERLVYRRRKAFGDLSDLSRRRVLIAEYLASRPMQRAGLDSPELADRLSREATSYKAMFTSIIRYYADSQDKPRCGEKTPHHALFLETLCEWFPNAVILHMIRDPRAAVASLQNARWAPNSVVTNARTWVKHSQEARRFRDRPGYLEIRYEKLVSDPAGELNRVCAFLGEDYSPAMLVPERAVAQLREDGLRRYQTAVTSSRLEVWRKELTTSQVAQIEWVVGRGLEDFGYAREAPAATALTVLRGIGYAAVDFAGYVLARLPAVWYRLGAPTKIAKYEHWAGPKAWRKRA
jgi:Sulfotransferase family